MYIPSESKEEVKTSIPPLNVPASIDEEEEPEDDAVKLGLGDFIFYRWESAYFYMSIPLTCHHVLLFVSNKLT